MGVVQPVVAIVDDDDAVRGALSRLVRSLSYSPAVFASGKEFLSSLRDSTPACALLDVQMPGLTGLEVLHRLRADDRTIPVIIISGFDHGGLMEACLEAGAVAFLLKPLDRSRISQSIQMATAKKQ